MSVITALTAQNTRGVTAIHQAPPDFVDAQIDAVLGDIGADAIKIGMLASAPLVERVAAALERWLPELRIPVVVDPVLVAQSGDSLVAGGGSELAATIAALRERLLPLATLTTPNLAEAAQLLGTEVASEEQQVEAALSLARISAAALVKGGHGEDGRSDPVVDVLASGGGLLRLAHPRVATDCNHGTGCTLSSAIAARLARGDSLPAAVGGAIDYVARALAAAQPLGSGHGPVDHLVGLEPVR